MRKGGVGLQIVHSRGPCGCGGSSICWEAQVVQVMHYTASEGSVLDHVGCCPGGMMQVVGQ